MKIFSIILGILLLWTNLFSQDDLTKFNSEKIKFIKISKIEYDQVKHSRKFDFIPDTNFIKKENGKFSLQTEKGKITVIDTITDDETSNVKFKYIGKNDCVNQYIIERSLYESSEYYFVDKKTGDFSSLWNLPKISPNCIYVCSLNLMWGMDGYPGGVLILRRDLKTGTISTYFKIEYDNWVSIDGYWINNTEFNFKIISSKYFDYSYDQRVSKQNETKVRYWRIRLEAK